MTNEAVSSIKTLDVTGPRKEPTNATLTVVKAAYELLGERRIVISCQSQYQFGLGKEEEMMYLAGEPEEAEPCYGGVSGVIVASAGAIVGRVRDLWQQTVHHVKLPNAVGDVEQVFADPHHLLVSSPVCFSGGFMTSPQSATINVVDKKYSEVFQEVFALREPGEENESIPTEFAYWNTLKIVAGAYRVLRAECPRSVDLVQPTALVDSSGGVRLIWKTGTKQVKANFGGRPDLKSYLYYESGQVYDVETLDAPTLARRLGWLV